MPRRPTKHHHGRRSQPLAFSPFSRSVALLNSGNKKAKHQNPSSRIYMNDSPSSSGKDIVNHTTDSSDEEDFDGVVQADFAFFDPKSDDFHGVKLLLQTFLDDNEWDLSDFVELILQQTTVGTVVKIENDDDNCVYAVASALNIARYKDHKCIAEFKEFITKACQEENTRDKLRWLLGKQDSKVCILVSQRMVNLPPQLLPSLYDALFDEISWATEDEPTEELRRSFCFDYYLLVTKMYKHLNAHQKKTVRSSKDDADDDIIYSKPEDELFHKLSLWSFTFPLRTQQIPPPELKQYRLTGLVIAVEASKVSTFRQQLKSLITE